MTDFFHLKKLKISSEFFLYFSYHFAQNIDCGYMLEPPCQSGSNEYPQSMFWSKNKKVGIPLQTTVLLYKSGVKGGIYCTDLFS